MKDECHLCTLLWTQMTEEFDLDLITEYGDCPVFLKIRVDEEIGTAALPLIALVGPEPGAKAIDLEWDYLRYGQIPVARLVLQIGSYQMRGEVFSVLDREDRYAPHPAHGEPNTSSAAHMRLAKYRLSECLHHHNHCQKPHSEFSPTRLLAIDFPNVQLRLTHLAPGDICPQYCALSHCWGGATDIPVLNAGNLESLRAGIPVHELPNSFRDAIAITHALGLKHIWIDCLCIVQDVPDDWTAESAVMGLIYENAACTILAAAASDAHQGCFWQRRPLSYTPCRVAGSGGNSMFASDVRLHNYSSEDRDRPLFKRAWTLQERLLSTCVLEFNKFGVFWRCSQGEASEMQPNGVGYHGEAAPSELRVGPIFGELAQQEHLTIRLSGHLESFARLQRIPVQTALNRGPLEDALTFHKLWSNIVQKYSTCNLTRSTDRLVALSGIAQRVIAANPSMLYTAGMWANPTTAKSDPFKFDLLWWVSDPQPRPAEYIAPTWSWASQTGGVISIGAIKTEFTSMIEVLGVSITTQTLATTHTGVVRGGVLEIRGVLKSALELKLVQDVGAYKHAYGLSVSPITARDGERKFGYLLPDTLSHLRITHLLPLRKYHQVSDEYWRTIGSGFPHNGIDGLALEKKQDSYVRVGFFCFEWKDGDDLEAKSWFDGCNMQNIVMD